MYIFKPIFIYSTLLFRFSVIAYFINFPHYKLYLNVINIKNKFIEMIVSKVLIKCKKEI